MANKNRRGLDKSGKPGFRNILPGQDSRTHSNSAKGMKQPQFVNVDAITRKVNGTTDIDKIGAETRTQAVIKRTGATARKGFEFARQQLAKRREAQRKKRIETLSDIDHPLARKLKSQEKRVDELKNQIALNEKPDREDKLFDELSTEQDQLRDIQEKATELDLTTLSDAELKTLAVRHPETGLLSGLFGGGEDKFTAELVKRINKKKEVEKKLDDARREAKKSDSGSGFFDDFFKP